jgi:hypothetical protein
VRNAAQRKLFDELGIVADELPLDQFIPLGRMLYKAPSDGKWGEHECKYLNAWFPVFMLFISVVCCFLHACRLTFLITCSSGLPAVHGSRREAQPKS